MSNLANHTTLRVNSEQTGPRISPDIFGQFAEHLGEGIYGGLWVGPDSKIPNVRGIRTDVVEALRAIKVPVVRWPGGCFADQYHWRNGIGPAEKRPTTLNPMWGNVLEPNTFGTHEFLDFVEQIGSEAYISVNIGSGTVQEAADWFEYMTTDQPTTLGKERIANGRERPYRVRYVGLGNECWGCGGALTGEEYVEYMKLYSQFVRNFNPEQNVQVASIPEIVERMMKGESMSGVMDRGELGMKRIAVGPDGPKGEYTEAVMKAWSTKHPVYWDIEGLSLHFYTSGMAPFTEPATGFDEAAYAKVIAQTLTMDDIIAKHTGIMDKYDPEKKVALVVDEWGAWLKPLPDSNPIFLKQQNSLRDAILAALNINIFARRADRVRMTNIAQMVNVLQSMILTDGEEMVRTPTYHVFKMYVPFQGATLLPASFAAGECKIGDTTLPRIDAIAARSPDGNVWLALVNLDPILGVDVTVQVEGVAATSAVGEVLTAPAVDSINTFDAPNLVSTQGFSMQAKNGELIARLPPKSIAVARLGR